MEEQERKYLKKRLIFLVIAIFLAFSLIISRLWNLQIALGSQFAAKAKGNVLRYVSVPSSRGDILDKNGKLLATSVPQFAITLDWLDMQNSKAYDPKAVIKALANYVQPYWQGGHVPVNTITEDILATIQLNQFNRYEPVVVMQNIPADLQAVLAEHQQELPGITVEARPFRVYPEQYAPIFGNILGYVREVSESELPGFQAKAQALGLSKTYQQGDFVGKMGVENSYDAYLRGKDGVQLMEVDNKAQPVNRLTSQDPVIGDSLKLTIDADLQQTVSNSMDKVIGDLNSQGTSNVGAGAAVVIDVKTGKILAMVSKPNMDPNPLIGNISDATFNEYFGTRDQGPRLGWSRAFQEIYAPGSTFKMITGMAALQDGKVTPGEPINDSFSSLEHPEAGIADYYAYSKGAVNLDKGLADSINLYFEALGQRVMDSNPERLRQVALQFGLGQKTGIDLPGEIAGVAPSAAWKKEFVGTLLKRGLDDKLQQLQHRTAARLAKATSDSERRQIQAAADAEKKQDLSQFQNSYNWDATWHPFDTYNSSIGQGDNKYTILQLANYVATIANGGRHMKPFLVDQIVDTTSGKVVLQNKPTELNQVSISPQNLDAIKQAMRAVVTDGTAAGIFSDIPQFSGGAKTGTAQQGSKGTALANAYNGTFVAFAPYDNPQIAFAGVIENGQSGGGSAGLVAKAAFLQYFKNQGWTSTSH